MTAISNPSTFMIAERIKASSPSSTMIVVPCYNEEARLNTEAFLEFIDENSGISFVFVNDGSTDGTLSCLQKLYTARPDKIVVISLTSNQGKAEAVRQGLKFATEVGASQIGYWDADLATPLDAILDFKRIVEKFQKISVVFGSRRTMLGHKINRSVARRMVSGICAFLARRATGLPVQDTQCGAKLFRNSAALRSSISAPFQTGWLFDVELFARLSAGCTDPQNTFYEQPLAEWTEVDGSNVSVNAIIRSGFQMLALIAKNTFGSASSSRRIKNPTAEPVNPAQIKRLFIET